MKKFCAFLVFIFVIAGFTACSQSGKSSSFTASVLENNQTSLLVEPSKDSNESKSSDKISVSIANAVLLNSKGQKIDIGEIKAGDRIKITYNGEIAESYPAQIHKCNKIELLD